MSPNPGSSRSSALNIESASVNCPRSSASRPRRYRAVSSRDRSRHASMDSPDRFPAAMKLPSPLPSVETTAAGAEPGAVPSGWGNASSSLLPSLAAVGDGSAPGGDTGAAWGSARTAGTSMAEVGRSPDMAEVASCDSGVLLMPRAINNPDERQGGSSGNENPAPRGGRRRSRSGRRVPRSIGPAGSRMPWIHARISTSMSRADCPRLRETRVDGRGHGNFPAVASRQSRRSRLARHRPLNGQRVGRRAA